jgi:hypothetical protein
VRELDADELVLAMHKLDYSAQRLNLRVLPETDIEWRNATLGGDSSGLYHQETRSPLGDASQMREMPVSHMAIVSRVLAEGGELFVLDRNHDQIFLGYILQFGCETRRRESSAA